MWRCSLVYEALHRLQLLYVVKLRTVSKREKFKVLRVTLVAETFSHTNERASLREEGGVVNIGEPTMAIDDNVFLSNKQLASK